MMLATLTKQASLVLTEDESEKLAKAINAVAELYETPMLDEKTRAWIGLSLVGLEVYGSRIATAYLMAKQRPRPVAVPAKQPSPSPSTPPQPISITEAYSESVAHEG
jgi:hypothetical protein